MPLESGFQWMVMDEVNGSAASGRVVGGTGFNDVSATITQSGGGMVADSGIFNAGVFPLEYNLPTSGIIIQNNNAGVFTATFSKPIANALVLFSSIGAAGAITVPIDVSRPFTPVWYLDDGNVSFENPVGATQYTRIVGTEGYTIIRIDGTMTEVSFDYGVPESWCNIVFGFVDQNDPEVQALFCNPIFDRHAYGSENGCERFRRLRLLGYV